MDLLILLPVSDPDVGYVNIKLKFRVCYTCERLNIMKHILTVLQFGIAHFVDLPESSLAIKLTCT
jgi:hypothetical protein